MAIVIRVMAILGALWTSLVLGLTATLGTLVTFTDWFDPTHVREFVGVVVGLELFLLFVLWHAGKLRLAAAPGLILWFVVLSALINYPGNLSNGLAVLGNMMIFFLPVTLTLFFLVLHGVTTYVKARRGAPQKGEATLQVP